MSQQQGYEQQGYEPPETKKIVMKKPSKKQMSGGGGFDDETLMKALDNDIHNDLIQLTTAKIKAMNREILSELIWESNEDLGKALVLLKNYRYVENMNEIKNGNFIRWIDIRDAEESAVLNKGGIVCDLKVGDSGVAVVVKNFARVYFTIPLESNLIFQKLSNQERVILYALDHVNC